MAKTFTSKEAKRLIKDHQALKELLNTARASEEQFYKEIEIAADQMIDEKVLEILREVPVEELNRDKRGIRTKALRDYGYETIADIITESVYRIASVRGISQDTAYRIKEIVNDWQGQARQGIKIQLSIDDKNLQATNLVTAVAKYKSWKPLAVRCQNLFLTYGNKIDYAIEDLNPATNIIKWFFLPKRNKQKAVDAYTILNELNENEYNSEIRTLLSALYKIQNMSAEEAWGDFKTNSIRFFNIMEDSVPGLLGSKDAAYGLPEELAQKIQDECFYPEGLCCELRNYQEWGVKYILHQERVLLGDEMGLGKTIQAIATMVSLKNTGATHFVVVCPASVLTNWCREIRSMSRLRVTEIYGSNKKNALRAWIKAGGAAVTTYETTDCFQLDASFRFSLLVVDEAHYIKNPEAKRSVRVKQLCTHAERLLFMTGTPLENRVNEMVSLIQILRPEIANQIRGMEALSAAPHFREIVAPVYYRRKREDVLSEMPELVESKEWCRLKPLEEEEYERAVLARNYMGARRVSWNVDDLKDSSKAERLQEIIEGAKMDGRKVIVFSFFLDTIRKISSLLGKQCLQPIDGSVPVYRRQEILDEFEEAPDGTVLLAQIQSGGTGLNIQMASVVILCEPQLKPSIENQAISRAHRMGQSRNVLVYRLLCADTIDEKITDLLAEKQQMFDAFADKSVAAEAEKLDAEGLDKKTINDLIEEEIERINRKKAKSSSQQLAGKKTVRPVPVTTRIKQVQQPKGGYLNPGDFSIFQIGEGMEALNEKENINPGLVGLAVDYLTRFMSGGTVEEAFLISTLGAKGIHQEETAKELLREIKGLDNQSIINAVKLSGFDVVLRAGPSKYMPIEGILPDFQTIENIRIMVKRALVFLEQYGPKIADGFTFNGGYTKIVGAGDGDFLTEDTLWDFKVSKKKIQIDNTLQLMMYWRMGLHSIHPEFKKVRFLGIYNPRQNFVARIPVENISEEVIHEVDTKVIGYEK